MCRNKFEVNFVTFRGYPQSLENLYECGNSVKFAFDNKILAI